MNEQGAAKSNPLRFLQFFPCNFKAKLYRHI